MRKTLKPEDWDRIQASFDTIKNPITWAVQDSGSDLLTIEGIIRQILETPVGASIIFMNWDTKCIEKCEVIENDKKVQS